LATKEALEEGWGVVDAQGLTRSMAVDTRLIDGVHCECEKGKLFALESARADFAERVTFFSSADIKTDAIDPMVDELIMKLGICS